jgi:hypothetical protein
VSRRLLVAGIRGSLGFQELLLAEVEVLERLREALPVVLRRVYERIVEGLGVDRIDLALSVTRLL